MNRLTKQQNETTILNTHNLFETLLYAIRFISRLAVPKSLGSPAGDPWLIALGIH